MSIETGTELEGKVTGVAKFGAFIELPEKAAGLVHISQISNTYIKDINQHIKVGDVVKIKVLGTGKSGKYDLSMKQVGAEAASPQPPRFNKYSRPSPRQQK